MPHEKIYFLRGQNRNPVPPSISALKPIGNAYPASYVGQKQCFFSVGFG